MVEEEIEGLDLRGEEQSRLELAESRRSAEEIEEGVAEREAQLGEELKSLNEQLERHERLYRKAKEDISQLLKSEEEFERDSVRYRTFAAYCEKRLQILHSS